MLEKLLAAGCTTWADRIDFYRADTDRNVNIGHFAADGTVTIAPLMQEFVDDLLGDTPAPALAAPTRKPRTKKPAAQEATTQEPTPVQTTEQLLDEPSLGTLADADTQD